jgi:hypothetical protein
LWEVIPVEVPPDHGIEKTNDSYYEETAKNASGDYAAD